MGNGLAGQASVPSASFHYYLVQVSDQFPCEFDFILANNRFLKVARVKTHEGLAVAKVFVIPPEVSIDLTVYERLLFDERSKLEGPWTCPNCLPYQSAFLTAKIGVMFRQYMKFSLYDRLSTRPFLTHIEKKWIAFQLLLALSQAHEKGVCHGDIKSQNVLLSSSNWLFLSDFANFKPISLPEHNPTDFSYFFDTSGHRSCYVAPERFVPTLGDDIREATPAADVFSAGCVIAEMFIEGEPTFDLAQLLAYKSGNFDLSTTIERIHDVNIRELVEHMLHLDPESRRSANAYLTMNKGKVFPTYFYNFLQRYLGKFNIPHPWTQSKHQPNDASKPHQFLLSPDDKINVLSADVTQILSRLTDDDDSIILILMLLLASVRHAKYCSSKLTALDILKKLSEHLSDDVIIDRVVPHVLYFFDDSFSVVRASAVTALTVVLSYVDDARAVDLDLFPLYIFPALDVFDEDTLSTRVAIASNISALAEMSKRFLNQGQSLGNVASADTGYTALQETVRRKLTNLAGDENVSVKLALLRNNLSKLCVFFGKERTNDAILSHVITYLNDKQNWLIRAEFFSALVSIVTYVGFHCVPVMKPIIQQGLYDRQEFVCYSTIKSLKTLSDFGLIQKPVLNELIPEICWFLVHPNIWLRNAASAFIVSLVQHLPRAEVVCFLLPFLSCTCSKKLSVIPDQTVLLASLDKPIPRAFLEWMNKSGKFSTVFDDSNSDIASAAPRLKDTNTSDQLPAIAVRLANTDLSSIDERDQKIALRYLAKRTDLDHSRAIKITGDIVVLDRSIGQIADMSVDLNIDLAPSSVARDKTGGDTAVRNEDWRRMFQASKPDAYGNVSITMSQLQVNVDDVSSKVEDKVEEQPLTPSPRPFPNHVKTISTCKRELKNLINRRTDKFRIGCLDLLNNSVGGIMKQVKKGWRPRGTLVAHMHEHRDSINRIALSGDYSLFASTSNDGSIRLWNTARLLGRSVTNHSILFYPFHGWSRTKSIRFCSGDSAALVSVEDSKSNGAIFLLDIDRLTASDDKTKDMSLHKVVDCDVLTSGRIVDFENFDSGQPSLIYATSRGDIVGHDSRMAKSAWTLHNELSWGLITSLTAHSHNTWLVIGTGSGNHVCWDLRFNLPVAKFSHPAHRPIKRLGILTEEQPVIASTVHGCNELSFWSVETAQRQQCLWASGPTPLEIGQNGDSITSFDLAVSGRDIYVLTAGTDMRVRHWDLSEPKSSGVVIGSAYDRTGGVLMNRDLRPPRPFVVSYASTIAHGVDVLQEHQYLLDSKTQDSVSVIDTPVGHKDCISNVKLLPLLAENLLVTSSRDGIIKIWK